MYAFIRRHGHSSEDARDLTQEFFARLTLRGGLGKADPARGRFRAFPLASVRNYLSDTRDKARAPKRGGGVRTIPFEELGSRESRAIESDGHLAPESVYDRNWARDVLRHTCSQLGDEYASAGRADRFEALQPFLPAKAEERSYSELSRHLGLSEAAVRSEVHRLRQRFRALLRREVAQTVATVEEIDGEIRYLMDLFWGHISDFDK